MLSIDKTRAPGEDSTRTLLRSLVGALGGVSATGPMTIGMIWLHRLLPPKHRYSLPPREITMNLMESLGLHKKLGPGCAGGINSDQPLLLWGRWPQFSIHLQNGGFPGVR